MHNRNLVTSTAVATAVFALLATIVSCGGAESSIIGKWQMNNSPETLEFFPDGTVIKAGDVVPMVGDYRFISNDRMRIDFGGLGSLVGPQVYRVDVSGNGLTMVPEQDPSDVWELSRASADSGGALGQAETNLWSETVEVYAARSWQSTGIQLRTGDQVVIEYVSGEWTGGIGAGKWYDGRGDLVARYRCADHGSDCNEPMPEVYNGSLIGRVAGALYEIGNRLAFSAQSDGLLEMRMNDHDAGLHDNDGSIMVRVSVQHP